MLPPIVCMCQPNRHNNITIGLYNHLEHAPLRHSYRVLKLVNASLVLNFADPIMTLQHTAHHHQQQLEIEDAGSIIGEGEGGKSLSPEQIRVMA